MPTITAIPHASEHIPLNALPATRYQRPNPSDPARYELLTRYRPPEGGLVALAGRSCQNTA
jgi:hypothetical protein